MKTLLIAVLLFAPAATAAERPTRVPRAANIVALMERVADWQLAQPRPPTEPSSRATDGWMQAAGYAGIMALAEISRRPRFHDAMLDVARANRWKPGQRVHHADAHAVSQMYAELYFRHRDPAMLAPTIERFDFILANPKDGDLDFTRTDRADRWSWCDSLFMAPPAWVRLWAATGKTEYLEFAVANWWNTSDYLYDEDEHLYYRDSTFFDKREANGKKVFWSRGNGWVLAGLVRVMQYLPADHPARPKFERQFCEMAERIAGLQSADGFWRTSLLDPTSFPQEEASGTALFTYGLLWGINAGLLDRERHLPVALKGWSALVSCVQRDGKLIHVQPPAAKPKKFDEKSSEAYGVGAFLLAGSELVRVANGARAVYFKR